MRRAAATKRATKSSKIFRSTSTRLRAQQSCPALSKTAHSDEETHASRSASAKTRLADLPPSSSETRLIPSAAACITSRPTTVEPVNDTLRTSGWRTNARPATVPFPGSTLSTPAGNPQASASSPSSRAVSGVSSAGLCTTVLPIASAGASFQLAMRSGKFHGVTSAQTPSGSRKVNECPRAATGSVWPATLSTAPA
jgi:hypothetical protein